jgi:hypothetical protein
MGDCQLLKTCPFFNDKMANMPVMAGIYKRNFCQTDNSNCARYIIFSTLGREHVPTDLFPNQKDRAAVIVNQ